MADMMLENPNNEEKINKFHLAINHYAEEQRRKIEEEVTSFKQKELEEAEVDVLAEAYRLIQKEMAEMRNSISREMAQREMAGRRELLNKRSGILEEIFRRAAGSLREYAESKEYEAWLCRRAENLNPVFTEPGTVLYLRPQDMPLKEALKKAFGRDCAFQEDDAILLGGLRAGNAGMGIMAEETLDSLLENQRGWFEETCGLTVV